MEDLYASSSSKVPKLKALNGNIAPINTQREDHQFFLGVNRYHRPSFESYASVDSSNLENLDSTLIRYLRSGSPASASSGDAPKYRSMIGNQYYSSKSNTSGGGSFGLRSSSPLSAIENLETPPSRSPPVFKMPVKVEEDVLVMDGILVGSVPRARVTSASSDSGGSLSGSNILYRTEMCRPWEDSGSCRYGSKCQFAHGKEELRPSRFPNKNKSKAQTCKSFTSSESCTHGAKCLSVHHQVGTLIKSEQASASPIEQAAAAATAATTQTVSPFKSEQACSSCIISFASTNCSPQDNGTEVALPSVSTDKTGRASPIELAAAVATTQTVSPFKSEQASSSSGFTSTDWSPQDDAIEVVLPSSLSTDKTPSKEVVDAHLHTVLYGPIQRKRLPVFSEICPE
ncbi:hypothetical protein F0562_020359 [Nyssa sinensis]|uniref:C3H1-type domain-containing protein n=1 Tax=Nyssa sinensis TaxID=561372 RepID=A0A5J5BRF4_9ASTE|nr:hypothetical protein F0562_020359 [Nyssa sinensis]